MTHWAQQVRGAEKKNVRSDEAPCSVPFKFFSYFNLNRILLSCSFLNTITFLNEGIESSPKTANEKVTETEKEL